MESLNTSSRQILFEISGVLSSLNVVGISEILPFHEFSRLSQDMDVLSRIVSLQKRHSDHFDSNSHKLFNCSYRKVVSDTFWTGLHEKRWLGTVHLSPQWVYRSPSWLVFLSDITSHGILQIRKINLRNQSRLCGVQSPFLPWRTEFLDIVYLRHCFQSLSMTAALPWNL